MRGIQSPGCAWLGLLLLAGLVGCAGGRAGALPVGLHGYARYHSASPAPLHGGSASEGAGGTVGDAAPVRLPPGTVLLGSAQERTRQAVELGLLEVDAFEKLLVRAGLEAPPAPRNPFTPEDAAEVLNRLMESPVTLGTYPPRMAAGFVLREVLEGGAVSREELARRVERFVREQVAVLRPDGYLAWALDGRTQQRVGAVQWRDGTFRAGNFELGRFYSGKGGVFRHVDARLRASDWRPLAEVYDDADVLGRSLDGAEDAFVELYHGLGQLLSHPTDSLASLRHLPEGVAALIASSPAYWERFRYMTEGEQIREAARLTTNVVMLWGTASATTRTLTRAAAGVEATVPVLAVSAEGMLRVERVAVPVGRAAAVLSGGPGAAIVLQKANVAAAPDEPGHWGPAKESMSDRARRYQEQISGHSADEAYWVGDVKFDGFRDGVLREAKGPGYANKFSDILAPKRWFKRTGAEALARQARRQLEAVRGLGVRIEWHVAEEKAVNAIEMLFEREGIQGIRIVHTQAR
ncbi:Tox-REase-5 domain-containing protein [Corallococcus sp. AS-1-6]|uniref:Tox-REase-5 domain-containing protein n=1 Tax=Corallococcus sp. AS-1-6 TaxID=2874599 RepID=UPI001CBC954E|nr:Tox-REase-5 domain-containing protein [Corallococcus sp. AS-1-6]MBZ4372880.1 restriction endonuclease fold toxin 5 domain-containing protein [Corallococcus sp. AS-1-6]